MNSLRIPLMICCEEASKEFSKQFTKDVFKELPKEYSKDIVKDLYVELSEDCLRNSGWNSLRISSRNSLLISLRISSRNYSKQNINKHYMQMSARMSAHMSPKKPLYVPFSSPLPKEEGKIKKLYMTRETKKGK